MRSRSRLKFLLSRQKIRHKLLPFSRQTPQAQADVEWLMSYMLAHEGYRFDDVPMMERSFGKMSPTQLHTLREFYEKKHTLQTQHAATMIQAQQKQMSAIQAKQSGRLSRRGRARPRKQPPRHSDSNDGRKHSS